ncbi:MAG: class I SAM-dependent methyltransferase [candidate division WOR-3 bacterium]|nr:class I SAM-dependent methyltransferase [candidate division WOR-3 bacterium]
MRTINELDVLWTQILQFIKRIENPKILEIGCGAGQFANYLYDEGYRDYHGFDFSPQAIRMAKDAVDFPFTVGDATNPNCYDCDYNAVVALEVMEHVADDLAVIRNIKQGTSIVFSLPTFDDPAHIRWFTTRRRIIRRYYKLIDIREIVRIGEWFACSGVVENLETKLMNRIFKRREDITLSYIAGGAYRRIKRFFAK